MGGICGVVYADRDRAVESRCIAQMAQALQHHYVNPGSYAVYGNAGLGMHHPSKADWDTVQPPECSQPIHNENQTIWVVFVGELLNAQALATTLNQLGHQFYTTTEMEVLVHAYEEFEDEFLNHLEGTFAFALWDARHERLVLGRDRVGVQPLYFARHDQALLFGSELQTILAYPNFPRELNRVALNEYLSFTYVPTPHTMVQGISKLPPGHALSYTQGQLDIWQYWDADFSASENSPPRPTIEYETELLAGLRASVREAMVSEQSVGVLLDGSLGSSAIAALMSEVTPGQVKSFALRFAAFAPADDARRLADHLQTEHHELTLTPSHIQEFIPQIGQLLAEPLSDWSLLPQFFLAQFTRRHVPVALSGLGGETLFGGSAALQAHRLVEYYERLLPSLVRRGFISKFLDRLPTSLNRRNFLAGRGLSTVMRHHQWLGAFTVAQKSQLLTAWPQLYDKDTYQIAQEHQARSQAQEVLNQLLYCDLKLELADKILPTHHQASLAPALAVRFPLLNTALMETVAQTPHHLKLLGLNPQYILRQTLRNHIPEQMLQPNPPDLNLPMAQWLTSSLRPLVEDLLSPSRLRRAGVFEANSVRQLWKEHQRGQQDHSKLLWTLLAFELWYEQWLK